MLWKQVIFITYYNVKDSAYLLSLLSQECKIHNIAWGCCSETTQVASGLHCLLNNHFYFIPCEVFWETEENAHEARLHECGLFSLRKDCLGLQMVVLK